MSAELDLDKSEKLIFEIDSTLRRDIENKKISSESINNFNNLASNFQDIGETFFERFHEKTMDRITTFGASMTSKDICLSLKENLATAESQNQNPIAARTILERKYLMFMQMIISSLKNIYRINTINDEDFVTLNESVRDLIKISEQDQIYKEELLRFKDEKSKEILVNVLEESSVLISE